jgi:hypothetical protein
LLRLYYVVFSGRFGLILGLALLVRILGITFLVFHVADQGDLGGKLGDPRLLYQ